MLDLAADPQAIAMHPKLNQMLMPCTTPQPAHPGNPQLLRQRRLVCERGSEQRQVSHLAASQPLHVPGLQVGQRVDTVACGATRAGRKVRLLQRW